MKYVVRFSVRPKGFWGWLAMIVWSRQIECELSEFDLTYRLGDAMTKALKELNVK